jgi:hypothetical protein
MIDTQSRTTGVAQKPFANQESAVRSPSPGGEGRDEGELYLRGLPSARFKTILHFLSSFLRFQTPPEGYGRLRKPPGALFLAVNHVFSPKKLLTTFPHYINLSASVDITVSCRVVEGLAQRHHGNRLSLGLNAGANSSSSAISSGKMRSARCFVAPSRMSRGVFILRMTI